MNVSDFDFELPEALIAQEAAERGRSRLLVLERQTAAVEHAMFADLRRYLRAGDLLVLNDTRVFPARLIGRRDPSGGEVECLLMGRPRPLDGAEPGAEEWDALVHPGQKLKPGARMVFEGPQAALHGEVLARRFQGRRTVRLWTTDPGGVAAVVDRIGHVPLPPYIKREDRPADRERYQTVYAAERGSIAAPTAGLHFTPGQLVVAAGGGRRAGDGDAARGLRHFQAGSRRSRRGPRGRSGNLHGDRRGRRRTHPRAPRRPPHRGGGHHHRARARIARRVRGAATSRRAPATRGSSFTPGISSASWTRSITNFHLPQSSLLMLVAAFAGRERLLAAYREAVAQGLPLLQLR